MVPAAPSGRARRATALCALTLALASVQGCASMSFNGLDDLRRIDWKHQTRSWAERGLGSLLALALHESCHLALGAAFGAEIDAEMRAAAEADALASARR